MKKLALFAMLLGSSFLYGCGEPKKAETKKEGDKAPVTSEDKKEGTTTPPVTEEKKDGTTPTEEKK